MKKRKCRWWNIVFGKVSASLSLSYTVAAKKLSIWSFSCWNILCHTVKYEYFFETTFCKIYYIFCVVNVYRLKTSALFLNSVGTVLVSETRRFNYFMPWLKCKPILLWHTVLDGRDILLSTFYRRYTFTHTLASFWTFLCLESLPF